MSSDPSNSKVPAPVPPDAAATAEAKRRAARRRFLARGGAGSGLAIVTLYHQRAFATWSVDRTVLVSSPETCASIGGKKGDKKWALSSVTPKKYVERYECDVPYRYSSKDSWWRWW